jgi:hypothetical protein
MLAWQGLEEFQPHFIDLSPFFFIHPLFLSRALSM